MIETRDLRLRKGRATDAPAMYRNLWQHPGVFRYMFSRVSPDEEMARQRTLAYVGLHEQVATEYFVCDKATDEAFGVAGLKKQGADRWTLTDVAIGPAYQGRGYGMQVVMALLDEAFMVHGAACVAYECFAENVASARLAEACGLAFVKQGESELPKDGVTVTMKHYLIRREAYQDAQSLFEQAMRYIYGDGVPEDNDLARILLSRAHAMGHTEATYNLGICYHYGYGAKVDLLRAFRLYMAAAMEGHGKGMELVGRFYHRGIAVAKDAAQAEKWLHLAMQSGDPEAAEEAQKELERFDA